MSFLQKINRSVPLSKQSQIVDPVLYGNPEDADIYILTSEYNKGFTSYYQKVISKFWGRDTKVCVLYCFRIVPEGNDASSIGKFARAYTIDMSKFIKPWSKVICTGRAIYAVTQETELDAEAFYAYRDAQSWFFDPKTKSWVFPVDDPFRFISLASKRFLDNYSFHFFQQQVKSARELAGYPVRIPELKVEIVKNPNEFLKQYIGKEMKVAWDLETDGLLWYQCNVICLTMSFDGRTGYYLPWDEVDPAVLTDFFEGKYQIGANLKFDCKFLRLNGVENVHVDFDTMHAGHVLNEMRSNSLGSHGWIYTYYGGHEVPLLKYKEANPSIKNYGQIPRSILADYAVKDAIITYQVYEKELEMLEENKRIRGDKPNLYDYFFNEVMPNVNMYIRIEMNGINVDWDKMDTLGKEYAWKKVELEEKIFSEVGHRFNINSVHELSKIIKDELRWPDLKMTSKSGEFLTGEDALNEWEKRGYALATTLKQWKAVSTFIKTFIGSRDNPKQGWRQFRDDEGFLHPNYQVMMAESGRQKADSPNWQQCWLGSSQILTSEGFVRLDSLVTKEGYNLYEGSLRAIDDKGEEIRITDTYQGEATELISFELEDGSYFRVTPEHNCFVIRDGVEIMVQAKDIISTDFFMKFEESKVNFVGIRKINVERFSEPVKVYCVTTENHRVIVDNVLTSQCPKQGEGAKEFRLTFQPPKDSRNFVYSTRSVKLTMEDGSELEFSRYQDIKVIRDGEEIVIQARYLQEGDDFIKVV